MKRQQPGHLPQRLEDTYYYIWVFSPQKFESELDQAFDIGDGGMLKLSSQRYHKDCVTSLCDITRKQNPKSRPGEYSIRQMTQLFQQARIIRKKVKFKFVD